MISSAPGSIEIFSPGLSAFEKSPENLPSLYYASRTSVCVKQANAGVVFRE
jgi:hypothetical protein